MDILLYLIIFGGGVFLTAVDPDPPVFLERYVPPRDPPTSGDAAAPADPDSAALPESPAALPDFAAPATPADPANAPLVAEDQTPTGRMTTAAEVRPIMTMTRPQWVAVRAYDGKDLLYFTNLLAWRCGLAEISYAVNDGPLQVLDAEPCHIDDATPNALSLETVLPYVALPPGTVATVHVEVVYDDLTTDSADYDRSMIEMK